MFRYRLRTLLLLTILGPPLIWWLGPTVYESVTGFAWIGRSKPDFVVPSPTGGKLMVKGKFYGDIQTGDQIEFRRDSQVIVNGKRRKPE